MIVVRRLTIKDVARAAGVHPATASRALNPRLPGRISAETTARVERAAADLGYVVDPVGRSLRTRRSSTIGVLVPDLLNPFYPPVLRGIEHQLRADGFEALIASTDNESAREAELVEVFRSRRCEGYIVATATQDDAVVAAMMREHVPVVLVNRLTGVPAPAVVSDDAAGVGEAVAHLRGLGHVAIGHITGPAEISVTSSRAAAYRAAMAGTGVPARDEWVERADQLTAAAGREACLALLARAPVTAILAGNDMVAVGCYAAFDSAGLRCPADISLVGINDMPLAGWMRPALTTVAIPQEELGMRAARLIVERIDDPRGPVRVVSLPTTLIVRSSTGRSEAGLDLGP